MEAAGENIFKIIVVGPPGSGKTALVRRFVESKFTEQPAAVSRASQVNGVM
jgi:GTPase SAR1 family protein